MTGRVTRRALLGAPTGIAVATTGVPAAAERGGRSAASQAFPVGVPNMKAYGLMPAATAALLPTAPRNLPKEFSVDAKWWTDNLDTKNRRWLEWYGRR